MGLEVLNLRAAQQQKVDSTDKFALLAALEKLEFMVSHSKFPAADHFTEFGFLQYSLKNLLKSRAQLFQDLFVLYYSRDKREGFFVEFGATNGVYLSNTYLLEKEFAWTGILCEPGRIWQESLSHNRKVPIDNRCVWSKTGERFQFIQSPIAELSTLEAFNDSDFHSETRKNGETFSVETVSLNDLLAEHRAPREIDYLSIDTEGSEYEILSALDFNAYKIGIITVEHNFSSNREEIFRLLTGNGYKRVFEAISCFDDWYILQ